MKIGLLITLLSTADEDIDDIHTLLSTAVDEGIDDIQTLLSTADEDIDDRLLLPHS